MAKEAEDLVLSLKLFYLYLFYLWCPILPSPDHMYHKSPCMKVQKQNFVNPFLNHKPLSAVRLVFHSVLKSQGLSVDSSSKEREALFTRQIYTFYYLLFWNSSICIHCNSGEHQFNFSGHFHSSFPTQFGCRKECRLLSPWFLSRTIILTWGLKTWYWNGSQGSNYPVQTTQLPISK